MKLHDIKTTLPAKLLPIVQGWSDSLYARDNYNLRWNDTEGQFEYRNKRVTDPEPWIVLGAHDAASFRRTGEDTFRPHKPLVDVEIVQ